MFSDATGEPGKLAGCDRRGLAFFAAPVLDRFLETLGLFDAERPLADWVFFSDFFAGFFEAFLVAERFFAALPLFAEVVVFARFFCAAAFVWARRDLLAFFPLRFLTVFFLAIATTIPFGAQQYYWG